MPQSAAFTPIGLLDVHLVRLRGPQVINAASHKISLASQRDVVRYTGYGSINAVGLARLYFEVHFIGRTTVTAKEEQNRRRTDPEVIEGSTSRIRAVVERAEPADEAASTIEQIRAVQKGMKKRDRRELIDAALTKYFRAEMLKPYQAELIKLQQHIERTNRKAIILFDGRDASGKGGTIRRVIRYMNEKRYRVIALGKPTEIQRTELHMKRYIEHLPHASEIVLFDRSWYNRALVEPVMGFCTKAQYKRFMDKVVGYEERIIEDKTTTLIKLYFSVSREEQALRFERRKNDKLRQWKLSEVDLQAQELWDEFTHMKYKLLKKTHTPATPWYIIRSDDKTLARLETIKLILNQIKYTGRSRTLDFTPNPDIVIRGDRELKIMQKQKRKLGKFIR
jgi:polyphosphate kinase 2